LVRLTTVLCSTIDIWNIGLCKKIHESEYFRNVLYRIWTFYLTNVNESSHFSEKCFGPTVEFGSMIDLFVSQSAYYYLNMTNNKLNVSLKYKMLFNHSDEFCEIALKKIGWKYINLPLNTYDMNRYLKNRVKFTCDNLSCKIQSRNVKRLKYCGRCRLMRYCNRKCQINHWKHSHRNECPKLEIFRKKTTCFPGWSSFICW